MLFPVFYYRTVYDCRHKCFPTETMIACQPAMKCSFLSTHPTHLDPAATSQKSAQGYKINTFTSVFPLHCKHVKKKVTEEHVPSNTPPVSH